MPTVYVEPVCQLRHDTLLIYNQPHYSGEFSKAHRLRLQMNFKEAKTYSGKVTLHTKKRISKAINIMLQSLETQRFINPITRRKEVFKINFITLTVSAKENHLTAKDAYNKLLKPFLFFFSKTKGVNTYIWKAELTKKGQIHYHLTTSTWMHWSSIRNKWNYLLAKNDMLKEYIKKHGHANANSTDVHKVYKIRNISGYLHKELTKSMQNETATTGKLWDCSTNLKGQSYFRVPFDITHEKLLAKILSKQKLTEFSGDQFTVIKGTKELGRAMLTDSEKEQFANWITQIRGHNVLQFGNLT